jgi:hypothetical protein
LSNREQIMDSAILTLGALALVVAAGWAIDLLLHRTPQTRMQRMMAQQLRRSARAIEG